MNNCQDITNQFEDILDCVRYSVFKLTDFQNTNQIKDMLSMFGYCNSEICSMLNHPQVFFLMDSTTLKVAHTKEEVITIITKSKGDIS